VSNRPPNLPFPVTLRDDIEFEMHDITDRSIRWTIRRLVSLAYARGFDDGSLHRTIVDGNDDQAEKRAKEDQP
jgi:hypothetical protein